MTDHNGLARLGIEDLDPTRMQDMTESGELERPVVPRKIDCAGKSEVANRRQAHRCAAPDRQPHREDTE
jgi:hypothetical protein